MGAFSLCYGLLCEFQTYMKEIKRLKKLTAEIEKEGYGYNENKVSTTEQKITTESKERLRPWITNSKLQRE
ncbi:MAG: hypothetical protein AB2417_09850 [Clostridiaceae bacterium]